MAKTIEEIYELMSKVYPQHRMNWCGSNACACIGCVNRSSPIRELITREEWEMWRNDFFSRYRPYLTIDGLRELLNSMSSQERIVKIEEMKSNASLPPYPYLSWNECCNDLYGQLRHIKLNF